MSSHPKSSVLFIGRLPQTLCDGTGTMARNQIIEAIDAEYDRVSQRMTQRGWHGDLCIIAPNDGGLALLRRMLLAWRYDCVVISTDLGTANEGSTFMETLINHIQLYAPNTALAFTHSPEDALAAAARWVD